MTAETAAESPSPCVGIGGAAGRPSTAKRTNLAKALVASVTLLLLTTGCELAPKELALPTQLESAETAHGFYLSSHAEAGAVRPGGPHRGWGLYPELQHRGIFPWGISRSGASPKRAPRPLESLSMLRCRLRCPLGNHNE
jgi:hypothetical protein